MPDEKPIKPSNTTPLTIKIHIPQELGLTQTQVDLHKDKFRVEVTGTLGSSRAAQIVLIPEDSPSNEY